jgi:hypothetical protein
VTQFIEVRALAGMNYIRAQDVIAVQHVDTQKSAVMLVGGATMPCSEPAKDVMMRVQAALLAMSETPDGDASR